MRHGKVKRLCCLILAIVLMGSCFMQYAGTIRAAGDEPVYDPMSSALKYSKDSLEIGASSSYDFGVTIPENQTYYMSFTVKTDKDLYFDYRGAGKARLYLGQTQYGMIGLASALWPQGNFGLKDGARITFRSDADKTTLWVNGKKTVENAELAETGLVGAPKVSWSSGTSLMTDIKIWVDEPVYDEETGNLLYNEKTVEIGASSSYDFGVTVPEDETYFMSFTVKTDNTLYFDYRGGKARLILGTGQYGLLGLKSELWPQGNFGLKDGAKVTFRSDPDKTTLWINGEKVQEDLALSEAASGLAGTPKVSWASAAAQMTDVTIWTVKPVDGEPSYNEATDTLEYRENILEIGSSSSHDFGVTIPGDKTYFMSFTVKTDNTLYFDYRGGKARLILGTGQYGLLGLKSELWPQGNFGLKDGAKVTFRSDPDKTTLWINGEKVQEDLALSEAASGLAGTPKISWASAAAQMTDVTIWTPKDGGGEEPPVSDEPQYNEETDKLYEIQKVSPESTYADGVITTADSAASGITTNLAGDAEYYMTMRVKLGMDTASTPFVNIGSRGAAYFHIQKGGYQLVQLGDGAWANSTVFSKIQTEGVRVTMHSTAEKFQLWADGVKIVDTSYVNANESAKPDITWNQGGVTLSDIQIWTAKDAGGDAPIGADEPTCGETDTKYEIQNVTNGTYEDGVLMVSEQSNSMLLSDLPYNAAYYVTMKVKTAGAVSIGYRDDKNGFVQMQSNGYNEATGADPNADREWHDKSFPTLSTGARITIYSSMDAIQIWVDGEKIADRAYDNGGSAAPALTWTFSNPVEVSDICIWTKEDAPSDEPKYDADKHELHEITGVTGGAWKDGVLSVEAEGIAYFKTDLDADADYYMSYIVQTNNYVNISYRYPNGQLNIQSSGYQSIGTNEGWVNKRLPKLSSGLPVAVHSTPNHITIWLNGERIIDEAYTLAGESKPGISWSFADTVTISDVKIWTVPGQDTGYDGEIGETAEHKLSENKDYGEALKPAAEEKTYADPNPVGVNVVKEKAVSRDGQSEVLPTDVAVDKEKPDFVKASIPVFGAVALLGVAVIQLVVLKRKRQEQ